MTTRRRISLWIVLGAMLLVGCSSATNRDASTAGASAPLATHSSHAAAMTSATAEQTAAATKVLPAGTWGGEGAVLRIGADGATILEFDCATGSLSDRPSIRSDGSFSWAGEFDPERGNPIAGTGDADPQGATYHGELDDTELTLSVEVESLEHTKGPFTLSRDAPGFLRKCQ